MIIDFRHKGLEEFFREGKTGKINPEHLTRIRAILLYLNSMRSEAEILQRANWRPNRLTGKNPNGQWVNGHWSLKVSSNWRITYFFYKGDVTLVDYQDYH